MRFGQRDIAAYLSFPVFAVCGGQLSTASGATVPETAINEDCDALVDKDYIWLADDLLHILFPTSQAHSRQYGKKALLKPSAFAFDGLHGFAAVCRTQVVAHRQFRIKTVALREWPDVRGRRERLAKQRWLSQKTR